MSSRKMHYCDAIVEDRSDPRKDGTVIPEPLVM
jgi:hypothetical protein